MAGKKKTDESQTGQSGAQQAASNFSVVRIFIKDISFESKQAPQIFERQWTPKLNLEVGVTNEKLSEKLHEVVLKLTVTVNTGDETAFLIEIQQAGVFLLEGFDEKNVENILGSMCPNILFPYARESIDSLAIKGTFPAPMLAPINFDALMKQRKKAE